MLRLEGEARLTGAQLVTTEKDAMRIPAEALPGLVVLKVELEFEKAEDVAALIAQKLKRG